MVEIVSKHHRVLDAANELMWTRLAEEAPGSGSGSGYTVRLSSTRPSRAVWSRRRCSNPCSTSWTPCRSAGVTPLVRQAGAATGLLHLSSIPTRFGIRRPQPTALQLREHRGLLTFHDSNKSPSCRFRRLLHPLCTWQRASWRGCEHTCSMLDGSRRTVCAEGAAGLCSIDLGLCVFLKHDRDRILLIGVLLCLHGTRTSCRVMEPITPPEYRQTCSQRRIAKRP